jgi:hypothetical protein
MVRSPDPMLVYAVTIFISAFLLFQVQPMIAKIILPWFGGGAAVWSTCMMFFQLALLLGYLYSHATTRYLKPKAQAILHSALLMISVLLVPILIGLPGSSGWKPEDEKAPLLRILLLLGGTIGLPYMMLSTTGPLIQAWYVRAYQGAIPYRLFALSNFGSFLALLTFPFLVEPMLTSREQVIVWGVAFAVFAALTIFTGLRTLKFSDLRGAGPEDSEEPLAHIPGSSLLLWIALAATASVLLLAVTSQLTQNVAPIPFLWVLPLSVYLLSFILCFESNRYYRREVFLPLLGLGLAVAAALLMEMSPFAFWPIYGWSAVLFICCMVCHGELALQKPNPRQLTIFFLMVSVGGAAGGSFVAIAAPLAFKSYWELPIALVACAALATWIYWKHVIPLSGTLSAGWRVSMLMALGAAYLGLLFLYRHESETIWQNEGRFTTLVGISYMLLTTLACLREQQVFRHLKLDWIAMGFGLVCIVLLVKDLGMRAGFFLPPKVEDAAGELGFGFIAALAAMAALSGLLTITGPDSGLNARRLGGIFILLTAVLGGHLLEYQVAGMTRFAEGGGYRLVTRNFYGVLKVRDELQSEDTTASRILVHGMVNHGSQLLDPARRREITSYYNPSSGFGRMMIIEQRKPNLKVGITGLGAGVTAGFCRAGDTFRFYELNPLVLNIAQTWFTFLADCPGDKLVYLGDGRLNLERQPSQQFDVLAMDAFSSDSVPVHLLTREAFALYSKHLKPDGVLAVNTSNRYLNLTPVVTANAQAMGMTVILVDDEGEGKDYYAATTWMLCSRNGAFFEDPLFHNKDTERPVINPKVRPWTDDYSNLFQIFGKHGQ